MHARKSKEALLSLASEPVSDFDPRPRNLDAPCQDFVQHLAIRHQFFFLVAEMGMEQVLYLALVLKVRHVLKASGYDDFQ